MKNLKNTYQLFKSQLFIQYFNQILLYFSIPCLVFSVTIYMFYKFHNDFILEEACKTTVQYTWQLFDTTFNEIHKKYYQINSNKSIQNCMFLNENEFLLPQNTHLTTNINNLISYSIDTSNVIDSVYLYSFNNKYVYSADKTLSVSSNHFDLFTDRLWIENYNKTRQNQVIYWAYNENYNSNILTIIYRIQSNTVNTGLLVFNITEKTLSKLLCANDSELDVNILLKSEEQIVLSIFPDYNFEKNALISKYSENIKYTKYYSMQLPFTNLSLHIGIFSPNNMSNISFTLIFIYILFFSVVVPCLFALTLAKDFHASISNIVAYIQKIDPKDTEIENEMDYIESRLKDIISISKNFEQAIAKNIVETQQAQLISLQTQLNPHFLFNTLNALSLMNSTDSDKNEFEILIRNLSNILSYCLNTTKNIVTVSNEIEYSMYYVKMEEIKYNSKINLTLDIPKEMMDCTIPKFTFQPLLENCFKHGFKYIFDEDKKINISAKFDNSELIIIFKDNGIGISDIQSQKINLELSKGKFPQGQHIGIYNVNKRIQLIFGMEYGCRLYPADKGGTLVIINMPLK